MVWGRRGGLRVRGENHYKYRETSVIISTKNNRNKKGQHSETKRHINLIETLPPMGGRGRREVEAWAA